MPALRLLLPVLALIWLNAYICRDFFHSGFTGYTNSMQGFWTGIVRLATAGHWLTPRWWPWHDAGSPFEWTYAPLAPTLADLWSAVFGIEPVRGVQAVSGLVYCLGPVTLFLFCAVATRRIVWSFATAVAYSLLAPTDWVIPDTPPAITSIGNARRLYLMAAWDETPHYLALALLPLVLLFISRGIENGRRAHWAAAAVLIALTLMASAFGATLIFIGVACLLLAFGKRNALRKIAAIVLCVAAGWAIAAPSLPPSLIWTIRNNAAVHGDSGWDAGGLTALIVVVAGATGILVLCDRHRAGWWARFVWLFGWVTAAIPLLFQYFDRYFLPQPGRYKVEAELGLILAGSLACGILLDKSPRRLRIALALLGLALATEAVIRHRRYEKIIVRDKAAAETLEYRVARWVSASLPDARIALPGSLALWLNTWSDVQQFSGSSYSTAYNPVQQMAWIRWLSAATPEEAEAGLTWLKAFGVYAFAVPESGEFWKALNHPELYLPCEELWQEAGTTICRVPRARRSLAHVVPADRTVIRRPATGGDVAAIRPFTEALDAAPDARFEWQGTDSARILATVKPGHVVSVQISWHPGWKATANGRAVPLRSDGLGLTIVEPDCDGACEIRLHYSGGPELLLCHALRWAAVAGLVMWVRRTHLNRIFPPGNGLPPSRVVI
jgi:hypothetical protein